MCVVSEGSYSLLSKTQHACVRMRRAVFVRGAVFLREHACTQAMRM